MIHSQWETCLKERKRKYEQHLAKAHKNASKKSPSNSEYKRNPTNSNESVNLSIVSEDINIYHMRDLYWTKERRITTCKRKHEPSEIRCKEHQVSKKTHQRQKHRK